MESVVGSPSGGGLPHDVLGQIFFRLPARVLWRFRAVCRSWRDLTSDAHNATASSSSPVVLSWTIANANNIDIAASSHVGQSNKVLRVALPGLCRGAPETTRSWDGILCVELVPSLHALVNPLTGARTVVSAPAPRRHTRGYVAGAYSQPVTGIFHLLHCTSQQAIGDDDDDAPVTTCFRLMRVDGASASDWRDIPMSTEADTATLQTVAGYNLCASSATVHGRLHWRDMLRGQEELLVFDTGTEEFGSMPLPRQMIAAGDVVVVQQAITTLSGKLCLLRGLAEGVVEVWVLEEDYRAGDWWLTQRFDTGCTTPLHVVKPSSYLGNVGLVAAEDRVEKIVFCDGRRKLVYDVRRRSRYESTPKFSKGRGVAIHTESVVPHDMAVGAAPTQGVPISTHPEFPIQTSSPENKNHIYSTSSLLAEVANLQCSFSLMYVQCPANLMCPSSSLSRRATHLFLCTPAIKDMVSASEYFLFVSCLGCGISSNFLFSVKVASSLSFAISNCKSKIRCSK
ncbi:hypothetical protein HU200_022148 [Digitaria exilis]|uniref:F-box domain-containing protein n=1 Tax=Digitaria exilis TaxID=1010633 RepID=A0A835C831_9POAL|nr:hypothetical protein HU200_022148 [Digitaria exilis]